MFWRRGCTETQQGPTAIAAKPTPRNAARVLKVGSSFAAIIRKHDRAARPAVTIAKLQRGEEQEISVLRYVRDVLKKLDAAHAPAAEQPIRPQGPLRVDAAERRGVGRHAADAFVGQIGDRVGAQGRPAFAFAVEGILQAGFSFGERFAVAVVVAALEDHDLARLEGAFGRLEFA